MGILFTEHRAHSRVNDNNNNYYYFFIRENCGVLYPNSVKCCFVVKPVVIRLICCVVLFLVRKIRIWFCSKFVVVHFQQYTINGLQMKGCNIRTHRDYYLQTKRINLMIHRVQLLLLTILMCRICFFVRLYIPEGSNYGWLDASINEFHLIFVWFVSDRGIFGILYILLYSNQMVHTGFRLRSTDVSDLKVKKKKQINH